MAVMSMRRYLILGCMVAALQVVSAGQNPPSQDPPSQNPPAQSSGDDSAVGRTTPAPALSAIAGMQGDGTEDTSGSLPQIPALLGGTGISSNFISELERSNYLRGGVNVGAVYDSNPLLLSSGVESNTSESIFPNIKIEESSSRMRWTLGYAGGLTVNQRFTNQDEGSHNLNFDSQYRLSPHVNLRMAENFSITTGFFDAGNGAEVVAGAGGPNASLITPLSTQRSSVTTVETNYHFALNDLIGASGSFYDLHFSNVPAGTQLTDTQTASGSAFWLHRIFGPDWGGVSYRFDRITFNPGGGETQVHSFLAVDAVSISKRVTLSGFIGPQYSENQGLVPGAILTIPSSAWSVAGGVEGGWKNQDTSVSAGYSRTISDGGGVLGSVRLQTVHGSFRRQLTPGWAAALTASYGTNQSLTVPFATSASSVNLTSAGVSLERSVGKSIGLRMGYAHDFQEQFGVSALTPTSPLQTLNASRNRFFFTLSYQWAKPLGM
jgi:hypothetical protein